MNQELLTAQFDNLRFPIMQPGIVRVATYGRNRCNLLQFFNDARQSDIARVQNVIDPPKKAWDSMIKKVMRVGKNANFHCLDAVE